MKGRILIELTTKVPDSGSGMPDLGHDVYWLMKELPKLEYKNTNGQIKPLSDKYTVSRVETNAEPTSD
ncbi:MAG: hypothetical protein QM729_13015 [Solirubrobacterales bacterium]